MSAKHVTSATVMSTTNEEPSEERIVDLTLNSIIYSDYEPYLDITTASPDTRLGFFKKIIGNLYGWNGSAVARCDIYKIDFPLEDENDDAIDLVEIPLEQLKHNAKRIAQHLELGQVFPLQPPTDKLHLLFDMVSNQRRPLPSMPPTSLRHGWYQPEISNERKNFVSAFDSKAKAPSTQARTADFSLVQEDPRRSFRWSRPLTTTPLLPPILLSSHLRQFKEDAETGIAEPWAFELISRLQSLLASFADSKNGESRKNKLRGILQDAGLAVTAGEVPGRKDKNYTTDGDFRVNGLPIEIWELKEDYGWPGAEPWCRSLLYYHHLTKRHAVDNPSLNLPCLLNVLVGAQISFSGVVWDERPNVQVLTPTFPLFFHSSDNEARMRLARALTAYKKARTNLVTYYTNLPRDLPPSAPSFPDQTSFRSAGDLIRFDYIAHHTSGNRRVFRARSVSDNKPLVVKFTPEGYSREVHAFCARNGFAPALLGYEKLPGGWEMVVMEDLTDSYDPFDVDALKSEDEQQLISHFQSLHRAGFVHGDVRDSNILMRKQSVKQGPLFMIFDFDWSGKANQVYYPSEINLEIRRPADVVGLAPIKVEDDEWMLDEVLGKGHK